MGHLERFWTHVEKTETCWLWTAAKFGNGYGAFKVRPKTWRAHRWIVTELRGPIPDDSVVMHLCDVRHCVRPDHLIVATQADNQADMTTKSRGRTGDRNGMRRNPPKLTFSLAEEIREKYRSGGCTQQQLADEYGVHQVMISRIVLNKTWRSAT